MPEENNDWKLDMLRKLWGGEETDPEKLKQSDSKGRKKSKGKRDSKWPSVDLHKFKPLSRQIAVAEKAIDKAITGGHNGIIIIHGKGEGILRSQLIKELQEHPHVATFKPVKDSMGESGALSVRFK
ncbi:MAG: Smr/MutS family protein [Bacteroidetes bacterium]|nr:Smr/MutS family protein [Bacteroidota bacterium]